LVEAFEDLSSIDDADDDEDDIQEDNSTEQARRGPFLSHESPIQGIHGKSLTSTPRFFNEFNDKNRFTNNNNIHVIQEESLEGDPKKNDTDFDLQLLLKDNEKLQTENAKLKQQLDTINGDYTGLSFKFNQIQEMFKQQEQLMTKLKGELAAQEISKKTHQEALRAAQAKSAVAEETINSLRMQLSEMARSDCIERLRSQHEGQIQKMKEAFENERLKIIHEKDVLQEQLDSKDRRISHLQQAVDTMRRNSLEQEGQRRQSNGNTETLRKLKTELTAASDNNQNLKQQVEGLKHQIREAKNESAFHAADSQSKQVEINGLTTELEDLKTLNRRLESELNSARDSEQKSNDMISSLKKKLEELVSFCQRLQEENEDLKKETNELKNKARLNDEELIPKSQVEQFVSRSTKDWREKVQKTYEESFQQQVNQIKAQYSRESQEQKERLDNNVRKLIHNINCLSSGSRPEEDVEPLLRPLQEVWSSLQAKHQEQMDMLFSRKQEIDRALRELEEAVSEARSETEESKHEHVIDFDSVRTELKEARDEVSQLTFKLEKYKKHIIHLKNSVQKEDERREKQFSLILKKKLAGVKEREENLKTLVSEDATLMLQQINRAYSESIKCLKEQTDRYLQTSNSQSLEKMSHAIVSYHNLVMKKIEERTRQLQQDLHNSTRHLDNDISILEELPPLLLH
jgi:hypothetical protein